MFLGKKLFRLVVLGSLFIASNCQINRFQPVQTNSPGVTYLTETLRILTLFIDTVVIQCPSVSKVNGQPVRFEELFWINENNDRFNPDSNVFISSANLIDKSQLTIRINQQINYLSCGYLFDNKYVRIKLWTFNYIDIPDIQLIVQANPSLISYTPINNTFSSVTVPSSININSWLHPVDLLRLKCQTNYDIPLDTRYVWMYYSNPDNGIDEIWHRDDMRGAEDPKQIFMYDQYNLVTNRNESLSKFIQSLLLGRVNKLEFQCASYKDSFQLVAKSNNLTLNRGGGYIYTTKPEYTPIINTFPTKPSTTASYNNGPLIGGLVGGILGFFLLLGLLLLIIWCCCIRRETEKETTRIYYNQQNLASQSGVSAYPTVVDNIEITQDGWRNLTSNSAILMHYPTQSAHTIDNRSSRYQSNLEVNNVSHHNHQQVISTSNLSGQNGVAIVRSEVPDVYLKTMALPRDDSRHEAYSTYAQKDIAFNTNNGYLTDEEYHLQRREYFVNKNVSQQQHQQHESLSETRFQYI